MKIAADAKLLILLKEYFSWRIISAVSAENSLQAERATSASASSALMVSSSSWTKYLICSQPSRSMLALESNLEPRAMLFEINWTAAGQPFACFKVSSALKSSIFIPFSDAAISISSLEKTKSSFPKNLKLGRGCSRESAPVGMLRPMAIVWTLFGTRFKKNSASGVASAFLTRLLSRTNIKCPG